MFTVQHKQPRSNKRKYCHLLAINLSPTLFRPMLSNKLYSVLQGVSKNRSSPPYMTLGAYMTSLQGVGDGWWTVLMHALFNSGGGVWQGERWC